MRKPSGARDECAKTGIWSFEGRIGRSSFWATWLLLMLGSFAINVLEAVIVRAAAESWGLAVVIMLKLPWLIVAMWLGLAMQVKRWHDMDRSGLMVLWNFTLIAMPITFIMMGFCPGSAGPNMYGDPPYSTGNPSYSRNA